MTKVEFTTAKGSKVVLAIRTETPNLADHNVTNDCYDLMLTVNGNRMMGGVTRITHAVHGASLEMMVGGAIVPVPVDALAAIDALISEYAQVRDAHNAKLAQIDNDYETHHAAVAAMMAE